jgi:4-amino-4-deoxy-L-arabinose transferase-like glycosyltransferase
VTVDKPPVGLWLQAISAHFLGVNTLGVLLPEILAGIGSILVLYHLVRRSFGTAAGLLAALALAITPVVVATDRNNTIDSTLIFTLLLAAWAFIKATESGKLRPLLLGAALVGIGFNIKMLQAILPLPAFLALYLLGSQERLWRKAGRLVLALVVLLVVSLSWVAIVDLTPADQRPYVGSSGDNSERSLIVGYNGVQRLLGNAFGRGGFMRPGGGFAAGAMPRQGNPPGGGFPGGLGGPGGFPGRPGGIGNTGTAGPLRLFTAPLSKEMSWLLPFALLSALLVALRARLRWPIAAGHQAVVLWGGWLITCAAFFSVAGFFHEYYLSMLAPPAAALFGLGIAELGRLWREEWGLAVAWLLIAAGATLLLQYTIARAFVSSLWWLPAVAGLLVGGVLLLVVARSRWQRVGQAGLACVVGAMLVTPGIWSVLTVRDSSSNQSLPAAYDGTSSGPANSGELQVDRALLDYLQSHTQGMKYLMAVPSSMQGADYVLATGRPVLYLGGFMGVDQVETAAGLAGLVDAGELRYIYWGEEGRGAGGQSEISGWVASNCQVVQGFETQTRNSGAPDGTTPQGGGSRGQGFGAMRASLYDCVGE